MDRPKALALSVSLTGVIAAATAALALNFGLVGAAAPTAMPAAASVAAAPVTAAPASRPSSGDDEHEYDDDEHEYDEHDEHEPGSAVSADAVAVPSFGGGEDD